MSPNLIRWSRLSAMVGGVLWVLWAGGIQGIGWEEPGSVAYERYEFFNRLLPLAVLPVCPSWRASPGCTRPREGVTGGWERRASPSPSPGSFS